MSSQRQAPVVSGKLLCDVGEQRLLDLLSPYLAAADDRIVVGVGDDAAAVRQAEGGAMSILTTDMLVEGTHFPPRTSTLWHGLGHKALASNLSDIGAMAALPRFVLVSLGAPADLPVQAILDLYEGMYELAQRWGVKIIGGDTVRSPLVVLSLTVVGEWNGKDGGLPLRSNCRAGQNVYVSGTIGASSAGLRLILDTGLRESMPCEITTLLMQRHWYPSPRVDLGQALGASVQDLAMIDVSDSLYHEMTLLATQSGVGFQIDLDALPLHPAVLSFAQMTHSSPYELALFSGEEYELLFTTFSQPSEVKSVLSESGIDVEVTRIGVVTAQPGELVFFEKGKRVSAPPDKTFEHFRSS